MQSGRLFPILTWIEIPTVMYGGYALLRLLEGSPWLTDFRRVYFRAGHAHAGVLLLQALLYQQALNRTGLAEPTRFALSAAVAAGTLAQTGGFFLHMAIGKEGRPSVGTFVTSVGAAALAGSSLALAAALIFKPSTARA